MNYFNEVWSVLSELAPWLLLGVAVAGLMHILLPDGFARRQLGGVAGVFKAVGVGVPMPLCSCGVIPAGIGLKKDGASDGASIAFLISTPQTGVDSVLVSASFLGWPFALFKLASAAITGIVGGLAVHRAGGPRVELPGRARPPRGKHDLGAAFGHGIEILESIWVWLVVGVLVSAAITTWLPTDLFSRLGLTGPIAIGAVLIVSLPMYVCATASVPIAAALVAAGMPTGAALVFLMAGPATNVATIGAVHRAFGRRVLAIYMATLIIGSAGLGMLFDFVLEGTVNAELMAHHHGAGLVGQIFAGVLLALFAVFAWRWTQQKLSSKAAPVGGPRVQLRVDGMTCGSCANKLRAAFEKRDDVVSAVIDPEAGTAVVSGTLSFEEAEQVVRDTGYTPLGPVGVLEFGVEGLTCGGCSGKLRRAFEARDDVDSAVVDHETDTAVIHGSLSLEAAVQVVRDTGYTAVVPEAGDPAIEVLCEIEVAPEAASVHLGVEGLTCGGCAGKLRRAFEALDDVDSAVVDHKAGTAVIHGRLSEEAAAQVVRDTGYTPIASGVAPEAAPEPVSKTPALELAVEGLTCGGCAGKLRRAFEAREDVDSAEIDHQAGLAVLHGTISMELARQTVRDTGFSPVG